VPLIVILTHFAWWIRAPSDQVVVNDERVRSRWGFLTILWSWHH
jgi:hypothetical protein